MSAFRTRRFLVGAALLSAALAACSRSSGPVDQLPAAPLQALDGKAASLAACPTAKCLTVQVAPWCHFCREATPTILKLRPYLAQRGVTTRIVVGLDRLPALRDYAAIFGPDTLLDPAGAVASNGVPHFMVSDKTGKIIKDVPGMPQVDSLDDLASYFGLP